MTQEHKKLLLKDLSSRLPYGVKISIPELWSSKKNIEVLNEIFKGDDGLYRVNDSGMLIEHIKPYLFPLSSMTEEQKNECFKGTPLELDKYGDIAAKCDFYGGCQYADLEMYLEVIDWLLKNHFDIYDLIPMGLANDATGLNIY